MEVWSGGALQVSGVLFLCSSLRFGTSVLQILAVLAFSDKQVHLLNLERLLGSTYVLPPFAEPWKIFADSKLRQS